MFLLCSKLRSAPCFTLNHVHSLLNGLLDPTEYLSPCSLPVPSVSSLDPVQLRQALS